MPYRRRFFVGFAALVLLASAFAIAVGPGPQPATIPYRGHLDLGGTPLNSEVTLQFELFDDPNPASSSLSWNETHVVTPAAGKFAVLLGATTPVPDDAFRAAALYLRISVNGSQLTGLQPILPVASAHRADRADNLQATEATVTGTLAGNVISATSLGAVSANVGDLTATTLTVDDGHAAALTVDAIYTLNDAANESAYPVSAKRWTVRADYDPAYSTNNRTSRAIPLDVARVHDMCGDEDGCWLRLVMANYNGTAIAQTHASAPPVHFHVNPSNGAWRIPNNAESTVTDANIMFAPITGTDGDGSTEHVLRAWDCYFTDALYAPGGTSQGDPSPGFMLLNYTSSSYDADCLLIIDD